MDEIIATLEKLGFLINREKSVTDPSKIVLYLGLLWDLSGWKVRLSQRRVQSLREMAKKLQGQQTASHRQVARMLGLVQSSTTVVPLARAKIRQVHIDAKCHRDIIFLHSSLKCIYIKTT